MAAKRNKIGSLLLCLSFLSAILQPTFATERPRLMLSGAVLRYDKFSQQLTEDQWTQILSDISALGIKTLIIQYHHYIPRHKEGREEEEVDFLPQSEKKAEVSPERLDAGKKVEAAKKLSSDKKLDTREKLGADKKIETDKKIDSGKKVDASSIILEYADAHQMSVYMGLAMDQNWYANLDVMDQLAHNLNKAKEDLAQLEHERGNSRDGRKNESDRTELEIKIAENEITVCKHGLHTVQQELEEKSLYFAPSKDGPLAADCVKTADEIEKLYGTHHSFVGWYFPEEIWDAAFTAESIAVINPLLKFVSKHCQELSTHGKRSFAMSPYASRLHYDSVAEITAAQTELLRNSGVDVLMLQDSIGDLNLIDDEDIAIRLKKHFTAFKQVAANLNMQLWAELESFEMAGAVRKPTNIGRFKKQIEYSYEYLNRRDPVFVVYDYLHFFSLIDAKFPFPDQRAKLYDDYKREFVDGSFVPPLEKAD